MGEPPARRNAADGVGATLPGLGDHAAGLSTASVGGRRRRCRRTCSATLPAKSSNLRRPRWQDRVAQAGAVSGRPFGPRMARCATIWRGWRWGWIRGDGCHRVAGSSLRRLRRRIGCALCLDRHHRALMFQAASGNRYRRAYGAAKTPTAKGGRAPRPGRTLVYCCCWTGRG